MCAKVSFPIVKTQLRMLLLHSHWVAMTARSLQPNDCIVMRLYVVPGAYGIGQR